MPGRAQIVKRAEPVEREKPQKPLKIVIRDIYRKNTFACWALLIVFISWLAVWFFSRNGAIKSWASSQGLSYSGEYDFKFGKKFSFFDAISRGQKQYAFNVMKGSTSYMNATTKAEEQTRVQAFDFCYTEVKTFQQNKRVTRMDKTHEFSALVLDAHNDMKFKSLKITPRDMMLEGDGTDLPVQQADPDVEAVLKGPQKDDDDDDDGPPPVNKKGRKAKQAAGKVAKEKKRSDSNTTHYSDPKHPEGTRRVTIKGNKAVIQGTDSKAGKPWEVEAVVNDTKITVDFTPKGGPKDILGRLVKGAIVWEDGNKWTQVAANATVVEVLKNTTHPLSAKFNETFKVEAQDHKQADAVLTPALKQYLLDNPKFFIDFEDDQVMIYREFTIEPADYSDGLKLGKSLLGHLPALLPTTPPKNGTKDDHDLSVFVSKTEVAKAK